MWPASGLATGNVCMHQDLSKGCFCSECCFFVQSKTGPSSFALCPLCLSVDLGTNNVSGALSSLPPSNPRDDFDVFAQTRGGGSLADQHKT